MSIQSCISVNKILKFYYQDKISATRLTPISVFMYQLNKHLLGLSAAGLYTNPPAPLLPLETAQIHNYYT